MIEFKVNDCITLKLENGQTELYLNGVLFIICKSLLLNIPTNPHQSHRRSLGFKIQSIDEASEEYDSSHGTRVEIKITPKTEFLGHCSNLQAWVEHDYDTCLLHSNIAFPLLKELADSGDPKAKRVFKEEVAKRIQSGYVPVIKYLDEEGYLDYLSREELISTLLDSDSVFFEKILLKARKGREDDLFLKEFFDRIGDKLPYIMKSTVKRILKKGNPDDLRCIFRLGWQDFFELDEIYSLFKKIYKNIDFINILNYKYLVNKKNQRDKYGTDILLKIYTYTDDDFFLDIMKKQPVEAIAIFNKRILNLIKTGYFKYNANELKKRSIRMLDLIQREFKFIKSHLLTYN